MINITERNNLSRGTIQQQQKNNKNGAKRNK